MVYFRKRLILKVLGEINEMILRDVKHGRQKRKNPRMTMILKISSRQVETAVHVIAISVLVLNLRKI